MLRPVVLPPAIPVRSGRLAVREWQTVDAAALSAAIGESLEHLRPWMAWVVEEPLPLDLRQAKIAAWQAGRLAGGDATYGIWRIDDAVPAVAGGAGLHRRIPERPDILEIGYWVHVDHVRNGIAREAAAALTDAAFAIGATAVEIHHDAANAASAAVPRALGFQPGRVDPDAERAGPACDVAWAIDAIRWRRLQRST